MDWVVVCARLILAAVFAVAAVGKLLDQPGTRRSLGDFGVPAQAIPFVAWLLPAAELLTAVGLLIASTARVAAASAVLLLALFSAAVARALSRGETPDCHCFGQLHSAAAGGATLMRNAAFAALALAVVAEPREVSIPSWLTERTAAELADLVLGAALLLSLLYVAKLRGASKPEQPEPLAIGEPMPPFRAADGGGEPVTETDLVDGVSGAALVFISAGCPACVELVSELSAWQRDLAARLRVVVVHAGDGRGLGELLERHPLSPLVIDVSGDVLSAYRVPATPSALLVDSRGRIASRPVAGPLAVEMLLRSALREPAQGASVELPTRRPAHSERS